jgi:putative thioredoxin
VSASASPNVFDVAEADFDRDVIEQSQARPIVVDFWAPWCGPCRQLGPMLERLVEERAGAVALAKVNIDEAQNLAASFRIDSIPAVVAFHKGKPFQHFIGMLPEAHLRGFLDSVCPTEADHLAQQGAERETEDPQAAESLYRQVLELKRDHPAAIVGLARTLIAKNQISDAEALLDRLIPGGEQATEADRLRGLIKVRTLTEGLPPEATVRQSLQAEPGNAQFRYQLGCHLAAAGKFPEALAELLAAAEADRALARGPVKEAMVQVFHAVGVGSPLANEYRKQLTSILY